MLGISGSGKGIIAKIIENMFDSIALQLIGDIPRLKNAKMMIFSAEQNYGLPHLFVQAMANKMPNAVEQDALKGMLSSADGYVEALKNKTKSNLTERIDGLVKEAHVRKERVSQEDIELAIADELGKAKSHLKAIAESEATKTRNVGALMDITRVASSLGDEDPMVFFVVIKDGIACKECVRLHLMPDGVTPRVWRFSELKHSYHKRGEENPSVFGLHPHCRCSLAYIAKSYGFDDGGNLTYVSDGYDIHKVQRE